MLIIETIGLEKFTISLDTTGLEETNVGGVITQQKKNIVVSHVRTILVVFNYRNLLMWL